MSYTVIFNACGGTLTQQAQEIRGFLQASRIALDGCAVLLHTEKMPDPEMLRELPAAKVILLRLADYQPENALAAVTGLLGDDPPGLLLFAGDFAGRELAVRISCRLGGSAMVGVVSIAQGSSVVCTKNVYANNMQAELALLRAPACISVARGARVAAQQDEMAPNKTVIECRDCTDLHEDSHVVERRDIPPTGSSGLQDAPFVVAAGRGVKSREDARLMEEAAADMGAQFGVSRPLAMNAWVPLDHLIGVSGAMLAPKLCISVGISGAGAFLAGVESAGYLVAVNTDPNAAVMKAADVAVVDSYETFMPELVKLIKQDRG